VPHIAVHIVQRGHDRGNCFRHDTDYLVYLANLRGSVGKDPLRAARLLPDDKPRPPPPHTFEPACLRFADAQSRSALRAVLSTDVMSERDAMEGRFRSCLVDSAQYVIACRYIEAQSGACRNGAVGFNVSLVEPQRERRPTSNQLLTRHAEYLALAADETSRHAAYRGCLQWR